MSRKDEMEPDLMEKLSLLDAVTPRDPHLAERGRAAFIRQAQEMRQTVTAVDKQRHNGWMQTIQTIFTIRRKERSPMFNILAAFLITTALVLGGGGVTVAAAQYSQPDQFLYGVKLASEDIRLSFATEPQAESTLALEFADQRAEEIQTILQADGVPPESVQIRYQTQVEQAIQSALNLPDDQASQALQHIQTQLETQQQAFLQVQSNGSQNTSAALLRTQTMLQERLQWVETGLEEPAQLREQLRQGEQVQQNAPGVMPVSSGTPVPENEQGTGAGAGDCGDCTPASDGQGGNPWVTGTPTPNSGYGPGPGPSVTCTPGTSSGAQATQQQVNQPTWAGAQPTQSSSGNGQGGRP